MYQQQYGYGTGAMGAGTIAGGVALEASNKLGQIGGTLRDRGTLEAVVDTVSGEIDMLGGVISALESRLSAVLQPEAPQPVAAGVAGCPPMPPTSPAVGYLQNQQRRLTHLRERIDGLMSRLDT